MAVVRHNEARPSMVMVRWKMQSNLSTNELLTSNKFSELQKNVGNVCLKSCTRGEGSRDVFSHDEARPSMVVVRWKMESKYKMNY